MNVLQSILKVLWNECLSQDCLQLWPLNKTFFAEESGKRWMWSPSMMRYIHLKEMKFLLVMPSLELDKKLCSKQTLVIFQCSIAWVPLTSMIPKIVQINSEEFLIPQTRTLFFRPMYLIEKKIRGLGAFLLSLLQLPYRNFQMIIWIQKSYKQQRIP